MIIPDQRVLQRTLGGLDGLRSAKVLEDSEDETYWDDVVEWTAEGSTETYISVRRTRTQADVPIGHPDERTGEVDVRVRHTGVFPEETQDEISRDMEKFRQQAATGELDFLGDEEDEDLEAEEIMQLVPEEFHDWLDVFRKSKADSLPPHREYDHEIEIDPTVPLRPGTHISYDEEAGRVVPGVLDCGDCDGPFPAIDVTVQQSGVSRSEGGWERLEGGGGLSSAECGDDQECSSVAENRRDHFAVVSGQAVHQLRPAESLSAGAHEGGPGEVDGHSAVHRSA